MTGGTTTARARQSGRTPCRFAAAHRMCAHANARTPNRNPVVRTPQRMNTSNASPQNAATNPSVMRSVRCFMSKSGLYHSVRRRIKRNLAKIAFQTLVLCRQPGCAKMHS